jgi:hypothetical protein
LHSYYLSLTEQNEERLMVLRKEKRTILDKVMETETYRVAKELLEKYDPATLAKDKVQQGHQSREWKMPNQSVLVQRNTMNTSQMAPNTPRLMVAPGTPPNLVAMPIHATPVRPSLMPPQPQSAAMPNTPIRPVPFTVSPMPRPPVAVSSLTRPIAAQDRSIVEKMVDYMIGDGPNNRYALICVHCASHNGMALKEEFEFLAFRCCYCMAFNPARKQKPMAPRLAQHFQLAAQAHDLTISGHNETKCLTDSENAPSQIEEPDSEHESDDKLKIEDVTNLIEHEEPVVTSSDDGREDLKSDQPKKEVTPSVTTNEPDTSRLDEKDDIEFIDREEVSSA